MNGCTWVSYEISLCVKQLYCTWNDYILRTPPKPIAVYTPRTGKRSDKRAKCIHTRFHKCGHFWLSIAVSLGESQFGNHRSITGVRSVSSKRYSQTPSIAENDRTYGTDYATQDATGKHERLHHSRLLLNIESSTTNAKPNEHASSQLWNIVLAYTLALQISISFIYLQLVLSVHFVLFCCGPMGEWVSSRSSQLDDGCHKHR